MNNIRSLPGSPSRLGTYGYPPFEQDRYGYTPSPRRGFSLLSPFRGRRGRDRYSDEVLVGYQQQEMSNLRQQVQQQEAEIRRLQQDLGAEAAGEDELQERWNFLHFKYQLLIDMWALRVLDNEDLGARREVASAGTSDRLVDLRASGRSPRP